MYNEEKKNELNENIKIEFINDSFIQTVPTSSPEFNVSELSSTPLRLQHVESNNETKDFVPHPEFSFFSDSVMEFEPTFHHEINQNEIQNHDNTNMETKLRDIIHENRKKKYKLYKHIKKNYPLQYKHNVINDVINEQTEDGEKILNNDSDNSDNSDELDDPDDYIIPYDCDTVDSSKAVEPVIEPVIEPIIEQKIPKIVFIVPYRNRLEQYKFFSKHMTEILEDMNTEDYKIFYIHQNDTRDFNRGAMKNIGFIIVKKMFPNDYKNITLIFNDIDIMPLNKNLFNYNTTKNIVKHFYGFIFALGGIVSIKAEDFEKINGFPNFWSWGYEDNLLQKRVLEAKINIDRNEFHPLFDKNILLLHDGLSRIVNKKEFDRYVSYTKEGINSINNIDYIKDTMMSAMEKDMKDFLKKATDTAGL